MKKRIKTNGILAGLGVVVYAVLLFFLPSQNSPALNKALGAIAFILFLTGQFLRIIGRAYKIEDSVKGIALVKEGPYAAVRNPMYLGSFLMGLAFTFLLGNFWVALAFMVIFFARFLPQVRLEEKILLEKFGKTYQEYLLAVPRFMPKINKVFKHNFKKYLPVKSFPWLKKELWAAAGWLVLFLLVALLKDIRFYNLSEYLWELAAFAGITVVFLSAFVRQ